MSALVDVQRGNALAQRLEVLVGDHFEGEPLRELAWGLTCMLVNLAMQHGLSKRDLLGSVSGMWDGCAAPDAKPKEEPS